MSIPIGTYTWTAWNPASFTAVESSASIGPLVLTNNGLTFGGQTVTEVFETAKVLNFAVTVNGVQYMAQLFALPIGNWLAGAVSITGQNALATMAAIAPVSPQAPNGTFCVQFTNQTGLNGTMVITPNPGNPQSPGVTYTLSTGPGTVTASAVWNQPMLTITLIVTGSPTLDGTYTLTGFFTPALAQPGYRGTSGGPVAAPDSWVAQDTGSPE